MPFPQLFASFERITELKCGVHPPSPRGNASAGIVSLMALEF
jgi:hypothetical protein